MAAAGSGAQVEAKLPSSPTVGLMSDAVRKRFEQLQAKLAEAELRAQRAEEVAAEIRTKRDEEVSEGAPAEGKEPAASSAEEPAAVFDVVSLRQKLLAKAVAEGNLPATVVELKIIVEPQATYSDGGSVAKDAVAHPLAVAAAREAGLPPEIAEQMARISAARAAEKERHAAVTRQLAQQAEQYRQAIDNARKAGLFVQRKPREDKRGSQVAKLEQLRQEQQQLEDDLEEARYNDAKGKGKGKSVRRMSAKGLGKHAYHDSLDEGPPPPARRQTMQPMLRAARPSMAGRRTIVSQNPPRRATVAARPPPGKGGVFRSEPEMHAILGSNSVQEIARGGGQATRKSRMQRAADIAAGIQEEEEAEEEVPQQRSKKSVWTAAAEEAPAEAPMTTVKSGRKSVAFPSELQQSSVTAEGVSAADVVEVAGRASHMSAQGSTGDHDQPRISVATVIVTGEAGAEVVEEAHKEEKKDKKDKKEKKRKSEKRKSQEAEKEAAADGGEAAPESSDAPAASSDAAPLMEAGEGGQGSAASQDQEPPAFPAKKEEKKEEKKEDKKEDAAVAAKASEASRNSKARKSWFGRF